jgi:RNA polymerase sigma-70 factor (ECF subfamily)
MTSVELSELINGCLKNERASQKALYNYLLPGMLKIGRRYLRNNEDIKDLAQEAMMKVFNNLSAFKGESSISTWANRIMINLSLYKVTKGNLSKIAQETELISTFDVSSNEHKFIEGNLLAEDLLSFVQMLPEGKKIIFNLYVMDGYSHKEIAEILNINESTSKSQLSKAKEILVKIHQQYNKETIAKVY